MAEKKMTDGSMALQEKQYRVITIEATEKPQDIKLRVAAYARVSSASDDQLNSFAAQNNYYTTLISSKENWSMVDIYAEIIVPYMIRLRFRDFVKECKNLLIYRLSHTEGCAKVLFFCPLFSTDYFERVQLSVHDGNFAHPYNDEAVP